MNTARGLGLRQTAAREAVPGLVKAMSDPDRDVRVNAQQALLYFPEARFEPPADWKQLTPEAAKALARGLGTSVTGVGLMRAVTDNDVAPAPAAGVLELQRSPRPRH